MADYYTHFSFMVPIPNGNELAAEISVAADELAEASPARNAQLLTEAPVAHPIFGLADHVGGVDIHGDAEGVWIYSGDDGDIEVAASIAQWLLTRPGGPDFVGFEWANTCSKPRVDAFGGGGVLVTRHTIDIKSSGQALSELIEALPGSGHP